MGKRKADKSPSKKVKSSKVLGTTCRSRRRERSESPEASPAPSEMDLDMETDAQPQAVSGPVRIKIKPARLTEDEQALAIEFMEKHPAIYDMSKDTYWKKEEKHNIWRELGELLPAHELPAIKKWWQNQRDAFVKLDRREASASAPRILGPVAKLNLQRLSFLRDRVTRNMDSKKGSTMAHTEENTADRTTLTSRQPTTLPSRRPSATVSRRPATPPPEDQGHQSRIDNQDPGEGPSGRNSSERCLDFSPADSMRSLQSSRDVSTVPFGISRLQDNAHMQMMQEMQRASREVQREVQQEREDMRREREAWRERERQQMERDRERCINHYDLSDVPASARYLLLQLGQVMGELSPERRRNIDEQVATLLADCIRLRSTRSRVPLPPPPPGGVVHSGQELIDLKASVRHRTGSSVAASSTVPFGGASEPPRRTSSPSRHERSGGRATPALDRSGGRVTPNMLSGAPSVPSAIVRAMDLAGSPSAAFGTATLSDIANFDAMFSDIPGSSAPRISPAPQVSQAGGASATAQAGDAPVQTEDDKSNDKKSDNPGDNN